MCGGDKVNYTQKYLCGCTVIMLVIIVILSMVINFGGNSGSSVEMSGEKESALVEESSGIHLLEITNQGDGSKCVNWSISDYAVVVLTFIILLKLSHLLHYFCLTRKLVKKSVLKERQKTKINQEKLELAPVERILVPAL